MIFGPIFIAKYPIFAKINKFNDFISVFVDFILLNILLVIINIYCLINNFANTFWYISLALPITLAVYLILNLLLCVRFLKINKLLKTSIILSIIEFFWFIIPMFINVENEKVQKEIDQLNPFTADFSKWIPDVTLDNNISCIIFLSIITLSVAFLISGLALHFKKKKHN